MKTPKVSICIPVYNVEKYIERCATSLFEQTYGSIEFIFVNDCTPDNSISILKKVIDNYPGRKDDVVILEHDKNRGSAAARNTALSQCSGDFMMWVDADDYINRETVELCVKKQSENDSDIVFFNAFNYCDNPTYKDSKEMTLLLIKRKVPVVLWGKLIRTSLYRDNGIKFTEGVNIGEDYQVITQIAYYTKSISTIERKLYFYNKSNTNAYSYKFSEKKDRQLWLAMSMIKSFFKNKPFEYIEALNYAYTTLLATSVIGCYKLKGHSEYKKELMDKLHSVDKKSWKRLPISLRLVYCLSDYKLILRFYILTGSAVKRICSKQ